LHHLSNLPLCLHSQPITAHDLAYVGQQRTNMFENSQHCWTTICWPTFWTHDRLLLANTVGQMLANICLSCVRDLF